MGAPKMRLPIPKPRPRTACDWKTIAPPTVCPETETEPFPEIGRRLCKAHREKLIEVALGSPDRVWAVREIVREELGR